MIEVLELEGAAILRVRDEIDMMSAARLEHLIRTVELSGSNRVLLSFEHCNYVDSTCLAVVLRAIGRIGGRLGVVVPAGSRAWRLFEVTGLAQASFVFGSVEAALAA